MEVRAVSVGSARSEWEDGRLDPATPYDPCGGRAVKGAYACLHAIAVCAVLILAAPSPAAAEAERTAQPRKTAFVVGNSAYRHVQRLINPGRDAAAIAAKLSGIGFDVTTVIDGDQPTMAAALAEFTRRSAGSDIALFYFAGHGIQINGENYFLPVSTKGATTDAVLGQALPLNDVRRRLSEASPGLTIFILDACRDNPFGSSAPNRPWETAAPVTLQPGLAQVQGAAGMLIAYATQPGKLAFDGKGKHSPFTESLLRYLDEPGLEIRLMLGRVREDVVAHTNGAQVPWVEEAVLGEFYFSERNDLIAMLLEDGKPDDVTFWRSIWRSTAREDYEAYLARFPQGAFATLAANRLNALKASVYAAATTFGDAVDAGDPEQRRMVQNSLYWLGYYNGKLTGVLDADVVKAVQAFQTDSYEKPTGRLTAAQVGQLHDGAAASLITLGERLSERIVFDRARLRGIDRGITEIALPAYEQLKAKLAGDAEGRKILDEAKRQLDQMQRQRAAVGGNYDRAAKDYLVVVAAAGAGYAEQIRQVRFGQARMGGVAAPRVDSLASRREVFLKHALDYAKEGNVDEKRWLDDLR
jgi:hypothetical protein